MVHRAVLELFYISNLFPFRTVGDPATPSLLLINGTYTRAQPPMHAYMNACTHTHTHTQGT